MSDLNELTEDTEELYLLIDTSLYISNNLVNEAEPGVLFFVKDMVVGDRSHERQQWVTRGLGGSPEA